GPVPIGGGVREYAGSLSQTAPSFDHRGRVHQRAATGLWHQCLHLLRPSDPGRRGIRELFHDLHHRGKPHPTRGYR
ncbi:unnamed protein product, partial [Effrenium voratum]